MLILRGAGFALAKGADVSGLSEWIGMFLTHIWIFCTVDIHCSATEYDLIFETASSLIYARKDHNEFEALFNVI